MTRRFGIVASAACFMLIAGVSGSARTAQDIRSPQTVRIDFMALAKDGTPVTDLKLEDIVLRIDNKIRPVRTLQYLRMSEGLNSAALAVNAAAAGGATAGPSVA